MATHPSKEVKREISEESRRPKVLSERHKTLRSAIGWIALDERFATGPGHRSSLDCRPEVREILKLTASFLCEPEPIDELFLITHAPEYRHT